MPPTSATPQPTITTTVSIHDSYRGENFGVVLAQDATGRTVGKIDFSTYVDDRHQVIDHDGQVVLDTGSAFEAEFASRTHMQGYEGEVEYEIRDYDRKVVHIKMIEVDPGMRRQGIGRAMWEALRRDFPDHEIDPGYATEDGSAFLDAVQGELAARDALPPPAVDPHSLASRSTPMTRPATSAARLLNASIDLLQQPASDWTDLGVNGPGVGCPGCGGSSASIRLADGRPSCPECGAGSPRGRDMAPHVPPTMRSSPASRAARLLQRSAVEHGGLEVPPSTLDELAQGLTVELEHEDVIGDRDPSTLTEDDVRDALSITEDHLREKPNYYERLRRVEGEPPVVDLSPRGSVRRRAQSKALFFGKGDGLPGYRAVTDTQQEIPLDPEWDEESIAAQLREMGARSATVFDDQNAYFELVFATEEEHDKACRAAATKAVEAFDRGDREAVMDAAEELSKAGPSAWINNPLNNAMCDLVLAVEWAGEFDDETIEELRANLGMGGGSRDGALDDDLGPRAARRRAPAKAASRILGQAADGVRRLVDIPEDMKLDDERESGVLDPDTAADSGWHESAGLRTAQAEPGDDMPDPEPEEGFSWRETPDGYRIGPFSREQQSRTVEALRAAVVEEGVCSPQVAADSIRTASDDPGGWEPNALAIIGHESGLPDPYYPFEDAQDAADATAQWERVIARASEIVGYPLEWASYNAAISYVVPIVQETDEMRARWPKNRGAMAVRASEGEDYDLWGRIYDAGSVEDAAAVVREAITEASVQEDGLSSLWDRFCSFIDSRLESFQESLREGETLDLDEADTWLLNAYVAQELIAKAYGESVIRPIYPGQGRLRELEEGDHLEFALRCQDVLGGPEILFAEASATDASVSLTPEQEALHQKTRSKIEDELEEFRRIRPGPDQWEDPETGRIRDDEEYEIHGVVWTVSSPEVDGDPWVLRIDDGSDIESEHDSWDDAMRAALEIVFPEESEPTDGSFPQQAQRRPLAVGDKVRYAASFLQSIGAYTGAMGQAKGTITAIQDAGGHFQIATVDWGPFAEECPDRVNVKALTRAGEPDYSGM